MTKNMKEEGVAYGKTVGGKTYEFKCEDGELNCPNIWLTELTIPEGVQRVYCYGNQLTELILPEGVKKVGCSSNQITHLDLPESVTFLCADKEVAGLERYVGKVEMDLY